MKDKHLPGFILSKAGYKDRIIGAVPTRGAVDADIAAFQWFPREKTKDFDRVAVKVSTDEGKTWSDPQPIKLEGMPDDYLRPSLQPGLATHGL